MSAADAAADRRLDRAIRFYDAFGEHGRPDPPRPSEVEQDYRHREWQHRREAVADVLIDLGKDKRRERFKCCGACAQVYVEPTGQEARVVSCKCHDRWCDPCRFETAALIRENLRGQLFERRKGRAKVLRRVTLTRVSTDDDLATVKKRCFADFAKMRKGEWWQALTEGGVAFFEATLNKQTLRWHGHLHIIHEGKYLPHDELKAEWLRVTGDSSIVFVQAIGSDDRAASEAAKYASKGVTSPEEDDRAANVYEHPAKLKEAIVGLQGARTCTTFGSWRGFKLTERKKPDVSGWKYVGTLDEVIAKARAGDLAMRGILKMLEARRPSYAKLREEARPPPSG